jgi:hypothetical protein
VPLSYLLIRLIRHPRYIKSYLADPFQIDKKVTVVEFLMWAIALAAAFAAAAPDE